MDHSTRTAAKFVALLQGFGVDLLLDVRSVPRFRTNPRFNADVSPGTLSKEHIGHRYMAEAV